MVLERLRRDEPVQLDTLIEGLEGTLGSAEIFTALFELELRRTGEADAGEELCAVLLRVKRSADERG